MSPRAACRLETLGFAKVFDYVAGKADWIASGLPTDGTIAAEPRAGDLARPDPPTCGLADRIGDARAKVDAAGWDVCVVVNDEGCILGRLRADALNSDPNLPAEQVMEPGPSTQRPHVRLGPLAQRMRSASIDHFLVSSAEGRLIGVLYREDVERLEEASRTATWEECEGCPGTWRLAA